MQPNIACWVNLPKRTYIQNHPFIVIVYLVPFLSLKTVLIILGSMKQKTADWFAI